MPEGWCFQYSYGLTRSHFDQSRNPSTTYGHLLADELRLCTGLDPSILIVCKSSNNVASLSASTAETQTDVVVEWRSHLLILVLLLQLMLLMYLDELYQ